MTPGEAAAQLATIRTLMERSALYRRALTPIALAVGCIGLAGALTGYGLRIDSAAGFTAWWLGTGLASAAVALVLIRRQALKDREPFWSPPTRRVSQAMVPALGAGVAIAVPFLLDQPLAVRVTWLLPALWMVLYGLALHAAGFFATRGIRLLGWVFIIAGGADLLWWTCPLNQFPPTGRSHLVMGAAFGVGHLAYAAYLRFTENRTPAREP